MSKQIKNLGTEILYESPEICALLFAGAGFYVSQLDHRVRQEHVLIKDQLIHWSKMFNLGLRTMPVFQILGTGAAIACYVKSKENLWLYGAACLFAILPYTYIAIMPTNYYLLGVLKKSNEVVTVNNQSQGLKKSRDLDQSERSSVIGSGNQNSGKLRKSVELAQPERSQVVAAMKKWTKLHRVRGILAICGAGLFLAAKLYTRSK